MRNVQDIIEQLILPTLIYLLKSDVTRQKQFDVTEKSNFVDTRQRTQYKHQREREVPVLTSLDFFLFFRGT